jgi:predicted ATPase
LWPLTYVLELEHRARTSSYQITADKLGDWDPSDSRMERGFVVYTRDARRALVYDYQVRNLERLEDTEFDGNESLLAQIADPRTNRIVVQAKRLLEGWRVYHDVHVERGSPMRSPATTQYVRLVAPDGSNLASVLHTLYTGDREFRRQIDEGMRAGFGDQFEELVFQPAAAQQIQLAVRWRSSNEAHAGQDLSDGTLRFLFLLTVLASPEPASLIAIDGPEIGLHPSMLPVIGEYAAAAATRTQVIITSHSPVFLDACSRAEPQVTVFHWEDGETRLFPLASGALERWLEQYRLGQLFTSGDLEALSMPPVEPIPDLQERLKELPPEDAALPASQTEDQSHA